MMKMGTVSEILNITSSMFARLIGQEQVTATVSDLFKRYKLVITQSDEHKRENKSKHQSYHMYKKNNYSPEI